MLVKHNDSQYVHFSCLGWKNFFFFFLNPDLPTHFFPDMLQYTQLFWPKEWLRYILQQTFETYIAMEPLNTTF